MAVIKSYFLPKLLWILSCCALGIALTLAIGLIPVNRDFREDPDGIEIYVYSDSAHSEFVFPVENKIKDWRKTFDHRFFPSDSMTHSFVGVGWGEKKFFIETPTWADLKLTTTLRAMCWPTKSAIKITYQDKPDVGSDVRKIKISPAQYAKLVKYVENTVQFDDQVKWIKGASHGEHSRFFDARGNYHMFWTCNAWIGSGLKKAGIKVGNYTPLPKTVFWNFPSK